MRVLFVTHYFPPEIGATQTRLGEVTASLARRGHEVSVVAPVPHYPDGVVPRRYRRALVSETLDEVAVLRTWVFAVPNRRVATRVLDYASFAAAAVPAAFLAGPFDVLFAETPPLFAAGAGAAIAGLRRRPYVCNVADLWVDSAVAVRALRGRRAIRAARAAESLVLRNAARVTAVTHGIAETLAARGIARERIAVIPNGVDVSAFASAPKPGARGPFTVLYAGNHGLAQGLSTLLDAAGEVRDDGIQFVLVGDGAEKERLIRLARERGLTNVDFAPPRPLDEMPELLAEADVCVVPLRRLDVLRSAVPSKLFDAMAAARPVVLAADGEAAALVERAGAGVCVPPEAPRELADAVRRLHGDPELRRRLGDSGRRYVAEHHSRERLVDAYERVLLEACAE